MSRSLFIGWAAAADAGSPALLTALAVASLVLGVACVILARRVTRLHRQHDQLLRRVLDVTHADADAAPVDSVEARQALVLEGIARLAGRTAHDLRNVLTALTALTPRWAGPEVDETARQRTVQRVERVLARIEGLTRGLAVLGRTGAGAASPVALAQVVEEALLELADRLPERIEIVTDLPREESPLVLGDPDQLREVVVQLVRNAAEAVLDSGRIEIGVATEGAEAARRSPDEPPMVRLTVRDTGRGLPADLAARAFDPLVTDRAPAATGLGLSTVKGVVEEHGGRVDLTSRPGHGTEVVVRLPGTAAPSTPAPPGGHGELVLVADRSDQVRRIVASALDSDGYEVAQAGTAEEALARSEAAGPRLAMAVIDGELPGAPADELLAALRDRHGPLPIILIPGPQGGHPGRPPGGQPGPKGVAPGKTDAAQPIADTILLQKPFQIAALCALVREALDRWPGRKVTP